MRVVFFGSGAFGLPSLAYLAANHTVTAVVTQPDKGAGRGGKVTPTPIGAWAANELSQIPILKPARASEPGVVDQIRSIPADAWVVIAYGQKLSQALLADRFAVNLHASLLPRWRGAAPINAAILAGDAETGNSVITLADRMDAGLILAQSEPRLPIGPLDTAGDLHDRLAADGPALLEGVLRAFEQRQLSPVKQDETQVTIASKLSREDDHFDARQPAAFLRRQVHALTPWPGISVTVVPTDRADERAPAAAGRSQAIKLLRVMPLEDGRPLQAAPGTLIDASMGDVACGQGTVLRLLDVQPVGRTPMTYAAFFRGQGRTLRSGDMVVSTRELVP